jgi:hypothetical protein
VSTQIEPPDGSLYERDATLETDGLVSELTDSDRTD